MPKRVSRQKYKGQSERTALALFGAPNRKIMETKEERETIAITLMHSGNPAIRVLAAQAMSPIYKGTSFAKLAENNALNIHMISDELKAIHKSIGVMRAAPIVQELIVQAAEEARSRDEKCAACTGTGKVVKDEVETACAKCNGTGTLHFAGDMDNLKLTFETFGLTGKGGGVNVNLDLRKPPDVHENMASLAQSLGPLLEGNSK